MFRERWIDGNCPCSGSGSSHNWWGPWGTEVVEHFLSESPANNAIDDEVDAGVDDHGEVGEVGDEPDCVWRLEIPTNLFATGNMQKVFNSYTYMWIRSDL